MFVRVVRFTDVDPEKLQRVLERIEGSGGPPPGVESTGIEFLHDASQRTALAIQRFETAEAMEAAAQILGQMDSAETPGARSSVDACELKLTLTA